MKYPKTLLTLLSIFTAAHASHAANISQTVGGGNYGNGNYGLEFYLDPVSFPALADQTSLQSITFFRGSLGSSAANPSEIYLNIYSLSGTGTVDFSPGSEDLSSVDFLGSSDNFVAWNVANGTEQKFNFSSVTLPQDTVLFAVFSNDTLVGNSVGASVVRSSDGQAIFNNISDANSNPLFSGTRSTVNNTGITYEIVVVPEPSSAALFLSLPILLLAMGRRRR